MLDLAIIVTLVLHLLCVHAATWLPAWAIYAEGRVAEAPQIARRLWGAAAIGMAAGLALGGALIALEAAAGSRPWRVMQKLPISRWEWFSGELVFSVLLFALVFWFRPRGSAGRLLRYLVAAASVANLAYHFPQFFSALAAAAGRVEELPETIDSSLWRSFRFQAEASALAVHHVLAGVAAGGVFAAALATWRPRGEQLGAGASAGAGRLAAWGARVALATTLLQVLVGLWVTVVLPSSMQNALFGDDAASGLLLAAGVMASLYLMHLLGPASLGEIDGKQLVRAVGVLAIVLLLMTSALQRLRSIDGAAAQFPPINQRVARG